MPPDLANQFNPLACQADFTYAMTPKTVKIQDAGKGKKSVADDLEAVLLKIEYWRLVGIGVRAEHVESPEFQLEAVEAR